MGITPERWQKIEQIYHAALECEGTEREVYLHDVCASDDELRREVESLLTQEKRGGSFLESPAVRIAVKAMARKSGSPLEGRQLGSYTIVSLLGVGGMGEVYQAHDSKLRRDVAIKVLPQKFVGDAERMTRFRREAQVLASLNHPNIATIHGLEQFRDTHYLVMELVMGQTLDERMKVGAFTIDKALKVAAQIAEALDTAHEKGVIHRDLKPANVKVTPEGRVKLLDFGLAKACGTDEGQDLSTAAGLTLTGTQEGTILGTPAYMSPEQARGQKVDKRADIWAFGCVLYELLTGKQAFGRATTTDTIAAVLEKEPEWQALPSATPARISNLLRRCLQKDQRRRLRDLGDARLEMQETQPEDWWRSRAAVWVGTGALIVVLAAAGSLYRSRRGGDPIDSVAVLPFVNTGGDPTMEYLSDGITESLINSLSQLPHLKVMSRDSAFRYKGKDTDAESIGSALGVRAVFKGRVIQRGDNLEISAELVDARDDTHIWGEQYSRKLADIFALQNEVAKEMTMALRKRLTEEDEKHLEKSYTADPVAYQDYLKGTFWSTKLDAQGLNKGIDYFQQAVAKDPAYALAYSGLADAYNVSGRLDYLPAYEAFPKDEAAARIAVELDDTLAEAHASLARAKADYEWDWVGAEKEFQRAIALNPNYADAHEFFGLALVTMGRFEEAVSEEKRSLELNPVSADANSAMGFVLYNAGRNDQAIEQLRKTLEMDPNLPPAFLVLGEAYVEKSMYGEAIALAQKTMTLPSSEWWAGSTLARAYARSGRKTDAEKVLHELNELSTHMHAQAEPMAIVYTALGDKQKAFEWLEKGYDERSLAATIRFPAFDSLRSDPRFTDLLRRMNLQP